MIESSTNQSEQKRNEESILNLIERRFDKVNEKFDKMAEVQIETMLSFKEHMVKIEYIISDASKTTERVSALEDDVSIIKVEQGKAGTERSLGKYILGTVFVALLGIYLVQKPGTDDQREILQIMKSNYGTAAEVQELKDELEGK